MKKTALLTLALVLTIAAQAQTIHWLTFIDTTDDNVGRIDILGRQVLYNRFINVINAARDLGANYPQTLFRVILPLSVPGIISGITMVFVPSLTTFVVSEMLGGSKILLIGNVIEQEFTQNSNWNLGSGLSIVLMVFIIISMVITTIYDKEGEGNAL